MRDPSMSNFRNWAFGATIMALILLGPIIAFLILIGAEMLADVLTLAGAPAVGAMAAGVIGWVLVLKYRPQARGLPLGAEGD